MDTRKQQVKELWETVCKMPQAAVSHGLRVYGQTGAGKQQYSLLESIAKLATLSPEELAEGIAQVRAEASIVQAQNHIVTTDLERINVALDKITI